MKSAALAPAWETRTYVSVGQRPSCKSISLLKVCPLTICGVLDWKELETNQPRSTGFNSIWDANDDVEKRKNGDVSSKALARPILRADTHANERRIMVYVVVDESGVAIRPDATIRLLMLGERLFRASAIIQPTLSPSNDRCGPSTTHTVLDAGSGARSGHGFLHARTLLLVSCEGRR